jgi:hypothetical protein
MRSTAVVVAVVMLGSSGCLIRNTISGRWTGCDPGDDIYVTIPSGHGPIEADHFACEDGGFEIGVGADHDSFTLSFDRHDAEYVFVESIEIELAGVDDDRDVGTIRFVQ